MGTTDTDRTMSAATEAEHVRMADMLMRTLRELNGADWPVNWFYAQDNSHEANARGWRALLPYAAVRQAFSASLLELCGGDQQQAEWLDDCVSGCGEDVAYCLDLLRKEWTRREKEALLDRAHDLLSTYMSVRRTGSTTGLAVARESVIRALLPLVGGDRGRANHLLEVASQHGWSFADYLD